MCVHVYTYTTYLGGMLNSEDGGLSEMCVTVYHWTRPNIQKDYFLSEPM
jgi:hypothetical protein